MHSAWTVNLRPSYISNGHSYTTLNSTPHFPTPPPLPMHPAPPPHPIPSHLSPPLPPPLNGVEGAELLCERQQQALVLHQIHLVQHRYALLPLPPLRPHHPHHPPHPRVRPAGVECSGKGWGCMGWVCGMEWISGMIGLD
ncbi:unnamed protein product [Closterium sp. NIES-54]